MYINISLNLVANIYIVKRVIKKGHFKLFISIIPLEAKSYMLSLLHLRFEEVNLWFIAVFDLKNTSLSVLCVWKVTVPKFNCNKLNQTDPTLNTRVLVFFGQSPVGVRVPGA